MEHFLGSITELTRLPAAIFLVDIMKEHIAVAEAHKLNIPTFAIADTNTDPTEVDFAIPANDDATKSIALVVDAITAAIEEGLNERKMDKEAESKEKEEEETTTDETKEFTVVEDEAVEAVVGAKIKTKAEGAPKARPRRGATVGAKKKED
jgi:small subunit ribosomal protein S2